jgi:hypothetical protein
MMHRSTIKQTTATRPLGGVRGVRVSISPANTKTTTIKG